MSVPRHGERVGEDREYCGFCDEFVAIGHTRYCIGVDPDLIETDEQMEEAIASYADRLIELRQREGSYLGQYTLPPAMKQNLNGRWATDRHRLRQALKGAQSARAYLEHIPYEARPLELYRKQLEVIEDLQAEIGKLTRKLGYS